MTLVNAVVPLSFAFTAIAVSYTLSASSSSLLLSLFPNSACSRPTTTSTPRSLAKTLLSLLGSPRNAAGVDPATATQLRSCLRFLVPFDPSTSRAARRLRKRIVAVGDGFGEEENEMVWWPPEPVLEIARIGVDSGGDPAALQRELDPTMLPVPDVEGIKEDKCQLTTTPYGRRFVSKELNSYLAFLFELIASRGPSVGLNVSLSRYDLFHGHMFLATNTGRLGILFHAREYPAYEKQSFPYNTGYCQQGSNVAYDKSMNLRNIMWLAPLPCKETKAWVAPGVLVVLDAHPEGIIYKDLVPEYVDYVRTIYEDAFGEHVVDVNYLNVVNAASEERIFIC